MDIVTANSTIVSDTGSIYRYELERKRAWNIGMRRHVNELTGNIVLTFPNASWNVFSSFDGCKAAILKYEGANE